MLIVGLWFGMIAKGGAASQPPVILAHYMPWFRAEMQESGKMKWEHWQWFGKGKKHNPDRIKNGRHDIASVYYPLIGPYDGRDEDVLRYHFLTARQAGIEGFVADWYGPENYTEEVFQRMVAVAEEMEMKVAICLEEKAFFPNYANVSNRIEAVAEAQRQIQYVLDTHTTSEAYLRFNDRPALFMFVNHGEGLMGKHVLTPEELQSVLSSFDPPIAFLRTHADAEYKDTGTGFFAWCGDVDYRKKFYAFAGDLTEQENNPVIVGSVSPGFDDTGVWGWGGQPRVLERRGTDEFADTWANVEGQSLDAIQIVTWNDFEEGSTIEPAAEYGFSYLDHAEIEIERVTDRKVYLKDNAWPHRIYLMRNQLEQLDNEILHGGYVNKLTALEAKIKHGRRFLINYKLHRLEHDITRSVAIAKKKEKDNESAK